MFPIHPALVHFPIALLIFSILADCFGVIRNSDSLRAAGRWAMLGALIGAVLAVPAGFWDWYRQTLSPEVQEHTRTHMTVGLVLLAALIVLNIWRWSLVRRAKEGGGPGWLYLIVGALVLGLTFYQGYLGHELVVDHGVGVKSTRHSKTGSGNTREAGHEHSH